jgi:hypothetical protein
MRWPIEDWCTYITNMETRQLLRPQAGQTQWRTGTYSFDEILYIISFAWIKSLNGAWIRSSVALPIGTVVCTQLSTGTLLILICVRVFEFTSEKSTIVVMLYSLLSSRKYRKMMSFFHLNIWKYKLSAVTFFYQSGNWQKRGCS